MTAQSGGKGERKPTQMTSHVYEICTERKSVFHSTLSDFISVLEIPRRGNVSCLFDALIWKYENSNYYSYHVPSNVCVLVDEFMFELVSYP